MLHVHVSNMEINKVKKVIVAMMFFVSSLAIAAGPYDGIWFAQGVGYFSVHENNGTMVLVRMADDSYRWWEASVGTRNGNQIRFETLISDVVGVTNVTMTSDTTFSATQESCSPASECLFPDGATFTGIKVF